MFDLLEDLAQHRREVDAAEAAWHEKLAEYHHSGEWRDKHYTSAATAIGDVCHMDAGVARAHVTLARKLEKLPEVADAFRDGEISAKHATVIARAFTAKRFVELSTIIDALVEVARTETPNILGQIVRRYTNQIDGDGGETSEEEDHERRGYHASRVLGNLLDVNGLFDGEAADVHEKALAAEVARDHRDNDDRTLSQKQADAMTNIMRDSLDREILDSEHGGQPHVYYVIDAATHPGFTPGLVDLIRHERKHMNQLSDATREQILCDCNLSRIIMNGHSEVLDVGRTTRTATPAQWKALVIRDGHCQHPGCKQPPRRCQAHHKKHWAPPYYGTTDLDNLELLCKFHHRERHKHDAQARAA